MIRMDYMLSKEIQNSKLSTKAEYYLAIPTMLFGRHCVPYIILLSFLLFPIHSSCFLGLSSVLTVLCTELIKALTKRPRPRKQSIAYRELPIRDDVSNPAFPSGDSAQSAVIASCLYLSFHNSLFLFIPLFTMFGRVYFGAHWIGDTIFGSIIGFGITLFITPKIFSFLQIWFGHYLPSNHHFFSFFLILSRKKMKIIQITTGSRYAKLDEDITFTIQYDECLTDLERNENWSVRYVPDLIFRDQFVECNVSKEVHEKEVLLHVNDFKNSIQCYSLIELRNVGCFVLNHGINGNIQEIVLIVQTYSEDEVHVVLERAVEQYVNSQ